MQKLRPPAWRRSRTPTPLEQHRGRFAASLSAEMADAEPGTSPGHFDVDPAPASSFLRPPSEPASTCRARSRSFDFTERNSTLPDEAPSSAGAGGAASTGTGPLLGMLRRSFSRHSSTSTDCQQQQPAVANKSTFNQSSLGGSSGSISALYGSYVCVHCLCAEEYERQCSQSPTSANQTASVPIEVSESEYDSNPSDESSNAVDESELDHLNSRLSFLGESFECRQKVEPWIRKNELAPDSRALMRRGRSLGLAPDAPEASNLRRVGSECGNQADELPDPSAWTCPTYNQISFNFSFSSSDASVSHYPVSDAGSTTPVGGRRSPGGPGTPRLERQVALCSGWLESEPSLDLLTPGGPSVYEPDSSGSRTHASMETHASVSLEVDSGACVGVLQQASLESQYSLPYSLDVQLPDSARQRVSSFESETSVDSFASSNATAGGGGRVSAASTGSGFLSRSSLLARRKCLSAGASPSSSPPICLSKPAASNSRLNLCTGSSSEYGDQIEPEVALSPSPPAEIYLAVPVLGAPVKPQSPTGLIFDKSRHLRQRFRRNDSSRSSSDKELLKQPTGGRHHPVRGRDSLHPDLPLRSRSIEIGLPTAHHHHHRHYHRTEYRELAGSARRQQWVSRLKYD